MKNVTIAKGSAARSNIAANPSFGFEPSAWRITGGTATINDRIIPSTATALHSQNAVVKASQRAMFSPTHGPTTIASPMANEKKLMPSPRREAGINRAEIVPFTVVITPNVTPWSTRINSSDSIEWQTGYSAVTTKKAREESTRIVLFEYFPTHCPANGRTTIAAPKKKVTNNPALSGVACSRSEI